MKWPSVTSCGLAGSSRCRGSTALLSIRVPEDKAWAWGRGRVTGGQTRLRKMFLGARAALEHRAPSTEYLVPAGATAGWSLQGPQVNWWLVDFSAPLLQGYLGPLSLSWPWLAGCILRRPGTVAATPTILIEGRAGQEHGGQPGHDRPSCQLPPQPWAPALLPTGKPLPAGPPSAHLPREMSPPLGVNPLINLAEATLAPGI
ncbi:uncharacterized protein LOC123638145 [Lemur catta]|uniref:uncharacterized protein LOC123638145 n=1 Tax=Lemur catta TaxID=9447 RepID=UPI001E269B40|nr:uncharacterized protein LOC123638145 [Lemur catta]XP_045407496.1 uncharacterized protein LOC123638145 [Lemur catta]